MFRTLSLVFCHIVKVQQIDIKSIVVSRRIPVYLEKLALTSTNVHVALRPQNSKYENKKSNLLDKHCDPERGVSHEQHDVSD